MDAAWSRYHFLAMQQSIVRRRMRRGEIWGILFMFAVPGCHRNSMTEIEKSGTAEGVRFTAEASVSPDNPDTIVVALRATNRSSGYRTVWISHLGKCGASLAFATGRGKATRTWRLETRPMKLPPGVMEVCLGGGPVVQIGPGASVLSLRGSVAMRKVLGDSLSPGLYRAVIGGDSLLRGGYVSPDIALR